MFCPVQECVISWCSFIYRYSCRNVYYLLQIVCVHYHVKFELIFVVYHVINIHIATEQQLNRWVMQMFSSIVQKFWVLICITRWGSVNAANMRLVDFVCSFTALISMIFSLYFFFICCLIYYIFTTQTTDYFFQISIAAQLLFHCLSYVFHLNVWASDENFRFLFRKIVSSSF